MEDRLVDSSSSFRNQCNYDVFLSFRGEDTRHTFTGHLYNALRRKGIHTFIDDGELKRGERISPALLGAIKQSRISIIIFSENYAFSSWCLDELVQILECRTKGQLVWRVFYKVDPSEVRHQKGSFGRAIANHERRFKDNPAKVDKWRLALTEAANLSGWRFTDGYEFKFVQRITEAVSRVQNHSPLYVAEHPVGLESRLSDLGLLLGMGYDDVRMIGIWGRGGIGKTTLARAMYNDIADQFDGASFVVDVEEESSKRGLVKLQEQILADILGKGNVKLRDIDRGISVIRNELRFKKVLLILDGVWCEEQVEKLAGDVNWFGPGSRIIITTRDRLVLTSFASRIYKMEGLNYDESLELFSWHAFKRKMPPRGYGYIAERAVNGAEGIPFFLKIIGSNLCGKKLVEWKCALDKCERGHNRERIFNMLNMIYDDLGENEKELLLDLACFFKGEELDYVERVLDACGSGIGVLIDKSLVEVEKNRVKVHYLILDMGRQIVMGRELESPGKWSRLLYHEEMPEVLTGKTEGTDKIEGILLDLEIEEEVHWSGDAFKAMPKLRILVVRNALLIEGTDKIEGILLDLEIEEEVHWSGDAFKAMPKLRILVVRNALFSRGPTYLPNSLKVLEWNKYPSPSLPEDFHPTELVIMSLPHSRLILLKPFKENKNLTVMDFTGCKFLRKIPDMSAVPNLTILKLDLCQNLVEIHDSVGFLGKLVTLSARSCIMLESFPHEIRLVSLEHLDLGGVSCLQSIPVASKEQENMTTFDVQGTAIEGLPSSLGNASKLKYLRLDYCTRLSNVPSSIGMLTYLTNISMVSCPQVIPSLIRNLGSGEFRYPFVSNLNLQQCGLRDEALPVIVCCFPNLGYLNLSSNYFSTISACINGLHYLQRFHLDDCMLLKEIEACPPNLVLLSTINCNRLSSKSTNMLGLAHQGSPTRNLEVILPATVLPECCDHYFGQGYMSFCVRKNFPDIPICLLFEMENEEKLEDCYAAFRIRIHINSLPFLKFSVTRDCNKTPNHVRLIHLHSYIFECSSTEIENFKNVEKFLQLEWNRIEILWKVDFFQSRKRFHLGKRVPGRVHIRGNQTTMEDTLFRGPPESKCSDTLSSTTYNDDSETRGIAGDTIRMPCEDRERDLSSGSQNIWTEEDDYFSDDSIICIPDDDSIICIPEGQALMEDRLVNSSSSFQNQCNYHVFLSFTGQDTRRTFIGHLYNALRQKGIHTFIDDEKLKRGEQISPALLRAIEQSRISIIVFSENYAFSSWCLDELVQILECRKKGQLVWPVFYNVDPSNVKHQKGSFGRAIADHERRFKDNPTKVEKWRLALTGAANLSGWHFTDGYEFKFIQRIIEAVSFVLNHAPLHVAEHPVGLESRISDLSLRLGMGSDDKRMIGIHGLGGIGKTTLAKALYNDIADQFEGASFVADVGENSSKKGLVKLQEEFLAEIIGEKKIKLHHVDKGIPIIKDRLCYKKVLLILDDVKKPEHLEKLAENLDWFGPGSRIIVTTRDKQLLVARGIDNLYEMKCLSHWKAIELFCWHAFKSSTPKPGYEDNVLRAVRYANGLPLALKVIGCNLCDKGLDEWKCELDKYEKIPLDDIQNKLKISYDDLEENEKKIFLDLACFFRGEMLEYVESVLDACEFYPTSGIRILVHRSLVEIENNWVKMHDLIQEMGREIVIQCSRSNPGERSRLWSHDDILEVLTDNMGPHKIEAIMMNSHEKQEVQWLGDAFKKMPKLRMLIIRNALFYPSLTYLPNSLKVLEWSEYPSPSLPEDFHPKKLGVMCFPNSYLRKFKPLKGFQTLTYMDFRECKFLTNIHDMSPVPNLTTLLLDCCFNLVEIHHSVGYLDTLVTLSAENCSNLESFPRKIKLMSLKHLYLSGCYKLKYFPDILGKMENISSLDLSDTAVEELPSSIENISALQLLHMNSNDNLRNLPISTMMLANLTEIRIKRCPQIVQSFMSNHDFGKSRHDSLKRLVLFQCGLSDEELPTIVHCFPNIGYLNLSKNNLVKVPACINQLDYLEELRLRNCELLEEIESVPPHLVTLNTLGSNRFRCTPELTNTLESNRQRHVCPGVPKCFSHCLGEGKLSFWFRKKLPDLSLCLAIHKHNEYFYSEIEISANRLRRERHCLRAALRRERVSISPEFDERLCGLWISSTVNGHLGRRHYLEIPLWREHVKSINLHSYIEKRYIEKEFANSEWNHVEIRFQVEHFGLTLIYWEKTETEDIRLGDLESAEELYKPEQESEEESRGEYISRQDPLDSIPGEQVLIVRPLEVEPGTPVTSSDAPNQIDATLEDVEMKAFYASLDAEASATSVLSRSQELANAVPCEKTKKSLKVLKEFLSKDFSTLLLPEQCSSMKTTLEQLSNLSSNDGISVEMLMLISEISRDFTQWSQDYNCVNRKIELASTNLLTVDKLEEGLEANKNQFKEVVSLETELSNRMGHLEERERELEEQINAIKSNISSFQTDGTSSMQPEPVQCNQMAHLEERKKELEEQINAIKCDISSFQTTKNTGTKKKREIFEEARTLKAQRDELREQMLQMKEESESAKKMQETIRAEWSKLGEKFNKSFGGFV